jgi:hypothetical protein
MNSKWPGDEIIQKIITEARRNPNPDIASIASMAGVSRKTMQVWLRKGMEAKKGKWFEFVTALQISRDQLRTFVAGRHALLATGGILRSPKAKTHYDDHGRPYTTDEAEYAFGDDADPNCKHQRATRSIPTLAPIVEQLGKSSMWTTS